YPMILDLIQKNGGTAEDAADIFQEGMVVLYEKVNQGAVEWQSTLKTFLYAVCRNKWLMELRKKKNRKTNILEDNVHLADDTSIQKDIISQEKNELMRKHFKKLGDDCQKILKLFFEATSMKDIGNIMGFSEGYAKKKKFNCQQKLISAVTNDPIFKELNNYDKRG
ncbi:MAG: sigma-70 family RNA polymerase sigma factor, partial [Leptospiraceae bacterium]|nr:sigma-70 family RNA polymerase sigma factor [Leptospiraceae bacterium]